MKELVLNAIKQFHLLDESKNITVALSGGADSMSLLYVLLSLRDELELTVTAAHLNHLIRGEEAYRDEEFVREVCKKLNVPFFCERADVPAYANEKHLSVELAAREIRYDFLNRVSKGLVATAHTASDNLETMLFNLTRGTSAKGLCGIPPKRDQFIRPLIFCTREDVEKYCSDNNISYVTDSTNLCDDYTRNKIRHNVIPVLKSINSAVESSAVKTACLLREDNELLHKYADDYVCENINCGKLNIVGMDSLNEAVAKRAIVLYASLKFSSLTLDNRHITDIYSICLHGGKLSLPNDMSAEVKNGFLSVYSNTDKKTDKTQYSIQISDCVNDLFKNQQKVNNLLLKNSLDCDKIVGQLVIRARQSGDSIRLKNHNGTKTLKKLYNEYHVPVSDRDSLPVIADDNGVVWIYGIGVAHRSAVSSNSDRIKKIEVIKNNSSI